MQTELGQPPGINLPWQGTALFARSPPRARVTDRERERETVRWGAGLEARMASSLPVGKEQAVGARRPASCSASSWSVLCVSLNGRVCFYRRVDQAFISCA